MSTAIFSSETDSLLNEAVRRLREGELVAIPTETVYGLAGDATNVRAIEKIFSLKGRPASHPLIAHCASSAAAFECAAEVGELAEQLAAAFWPGPMTLVLPRGSSIPRELTGGQETVAVRVPDHPMALELLRRFGRPLAAPSANRFGRVSPTTAAHVRSEFSGTGLLVLDGGPCETGIESTIIDCSRKNAISILRPGVITPFDIVLKIGACLDSPDASERPRVSGSLESHYAPQCKVELLGESSLESWLDDLPDDLPRTMICSHFEPSLPKNNKLVWQPIPGTPEAIARELYGLMHLADEREFGQIVFCLPQRSNAREQELEAALRDRISRAAAAKKE